jgi:peptidoglycan-associated lipoprotein
MKLTKFASLMIIGLALAVAATGCKSTQNVKPITPLDPTKGAGEPGKNTYEQFPPVTNEGQPTQVSQPDPSLTAGKTPDEQIFKAQTVHFAYDSHAIRSSEKPKIAVVADHLKANPADYLEVRGHCDERGTDQYNYSLGERRALALREELISQGVDGTHVMTVSFGRSRKVDEGHSEAAHAKNRRGVFILLTK